MDLAVLDARRSRRPLRGDCSSRCHCQTSRTSRLWPRCSRSIPTTGRWHEDISTNGGAEIAIGGRTIKYVDSSESPPDWGELGVDLVIDCTHFATRRSGAEAHFDRGAKRVLVSAPSQTLEDSDAVLLPGVNLEHFDPEEHRIVSVASCTTNALAPVVKVLIKHLGIKRALFSTVHAYTNTQSLTDQPMRDRRDSWAASENIIPSASGAAPGTPVHLARPGHYREGVPGPCPDGQHRGDQRCGGAPGHGR